MTGINLSRTFCAHECNVLGRQALLVLSRFQARTELITGGDPALPTGAVVFLKLPLGECKSTFLRIHPNAPVNPEDIRRQQFLTENMPWVLGGRVVFINPRYATHDGIFGGKPLQGFASSLANLVGYVDPAVKARRKQAKLASREERRTYNVRDWYYFA